MNKLIYISIFLTTLIALVVSLVLFYPTTKYLFFNDENPNKVIADVNEDAVSEEIDSNMQKNNKTSAILAEINKIYNTGTKEELHSKFEEVYKREDLSAEDIAKINKNSALLYFKDGTNKSAIQYIQNLKANILNEKLSNKTKAESINLLAIVYCGFGRDDSTTREIVSGLPFSNFAVDGDPALSSRKLLEWSYTNFSKEPTAAVFISRWYINRNLTRNLDKKTIEQNNELAKKYLNEADELVKIRIFQNPNFVYSQEYIRYIYSKVFILQGLILMNDATYSEDILQKYNYKFVRAEISKQTGPRSSQLLPYTYVLEAYFGKIQNTLSKAEISDLLKKAMDFIENDKSGAVNAFMEFASDSVNSGPEDGVSIQAIEEMRKFDKNFDSFMKRKIDEEKRRQINAN